MPIVTSATDALKNQRQVHVNGREYTLSEFVGAMPLRGHYQEGNESNDNGMPQGFLVTQPPGSVTPAHFHEPNQFQVFVDGSGRIGARAAPPLSVQYANGHTPYGPIVGGPRRPQLLHAAPAVGSGRQVCPGLSGQAAQGRPAHTHGQRSRRRRR